MPRRMRPAVIWPFGGNRRKTASDRLDFPQPDLADDADDVARRDAERDVVQRWQEPVLGVVLQLEPLDAEKVAHDCCARRNRSRRR